MKIQERHSPILPSFESYLIDSKKLFILSMALYINQLHLLVMQSWKHFGETQKAIAKKNNEAQRTREKRNSEEKGERLEAQRRYVLISQESPQGNILLHAAHRQAGKFRYFQGQYLGDENRHLNLPV